MGRIPTATKDYSTTRPLKVVSEAAREREAYTYDLSLADDYRINYTHRPFPSSDLYTSSDGVMTALAQLGLYQTGTERAFISLFDTSYQYIVAEALRLVPLTPRLLSSECPAPLSCCGTAIPRSNDICERVVCAPADPNQSHHKGAIELPVTTGPGPLTDSRFPSESSFNEQGQFYAAVPIRTRRGINIGVYCVLSSVTEQKWDDQYSRCLRDVSFSIMEHLEAKRSRYDSRRNERMNRGVGSFIEGKSTLSGWKFGPNEVAYTNEAKSEGILDAKQQRLEDQEQEASERHRSVDLGGAGMITDLGGDTLTSRLHGAAMPDSSDLRRRNADTPHLKDGLSTGNFGSGIEDAASDGTDVRHVFSRASNIIREAFEVAGCLIFDVSLGSYRPQAVNKTAGESRGNGESGRLSATSSSDELGSAVASEDSDSACQLLGFSTSNGSSINAPDLGTVKNDISRHFLAKLLRHYPNGKIFNFDAAGELQSSESSEDDTSQAGSAGEPSPIYKGSKDPKQQGSNQRGRLKEGVTINQIFPNAQSVAFMPIWDSKKERWFAGCFIYTLTPSRIFTVERELSLLEAFAHLITAEVLNQKTVQAGKAKSDALGSLSHELRSPMHGIILSTELLNDTELGLFQSNAVHTIETCCRTLLDTIDHLLDYSKINNLGIQNKQEASFTSSRLRRSKTEPFGKKVLSTSVMIDGLVEEVVNCVFAGFNFQHMSVRQVLKQDAAFRMDGAENHQLDSLQAMEQLSLSARKGQHTFHFGHLSVYVCVDPSCDWIFYVQAGAIRRIVMNLFGNALKYTMSGAIWVMLKQEIVGTRSKAESMVKLTVKDTGQGIGEDYLRHNLFRPFAQENDLISGTGLGLSIVKRIVSQLRGKISVESQVGIGTTVTARLPLERPSGESRTLTTLSEDDEEFMDQLKELAGMRVRLVGFESRQKSDFPLSGRAMVEDICRRWLHLTVVSEETLQNVLPDIILWSNDALPDSSERVAQYSKAPNIVVCQDALVAYQQLITHESAGEGGIFEFITQPIGPRKLARSILLAYKAWVGLPKSLQTRRPPTLYRRNTSEEIRKGDERDTADVLTLNLDLNFLDQANLAPVSALSQADSSEQPTLLDLEPLTYMPSRLHHARDHFLLVDDNGINLKVLAACMEKLGQKHELASNGQEAVDAYRLRPNHFAGILMDISMPVMNGLDATRCIRAHEHRRHLPRVPILTLTGLGADSTHRDAFECGVDAFLTKPVTLKILGETLKSMDILVPSA